VQTAEGEARLHGGVHVRCPEFCAHLAPRHRHPRSSGTRNHRFRDPHPSPHRRWDGVGL